MYVLNNVFDWYLLTSLASVVADDRMTFSTLLQLFKSDKRFIAHSKEDNQGFQFDF